MRRLNYRYHCDSHMAAREEKGKAGFACGPSLLVKEMTILVFLKKKPQNRGRETSFAQFFPAHFCGAEGGAFLSAAPCIHSQRSLKLPKHKPSG